MPRRPRHPSAALEQARDKPARAPDPDQDDLPPLHQGVQHLPLTDLRVGNGDGRWWRHSQAMLCYHDMVENAIVFVHGWGGSPGGTWEAFSQALATMGQAGQSDVFFLAYPSRGNQVAFCAAPLRNFLFTLVRDPLSEIIDLTLGPHVPARRRRQQYRRIYVVAHSMGAVIARRAIIDLDRPSSEALTPEESDLFRLLFFAPAHCGSHLALLIGSGLGLDFVPGAKVAGHLAQIWLPSLRDLEVGSRALSDLERDCRSLRQERAGRDAPVDHLIARVYHAHRDRVVSQNSFDADPPFQPVMDRNHHNICKPDPDFQMPVAALRAMLSSDRYSP